MKIVERYILREILVPYLFALFGIFFLLITGRMIQLTRYFLQTSISFYDIFMLMALATPKLSLYALPLATMLAIALAFSRMHGDRELIALQAGGVSPKRLWRPILVFALANTVITATMSIVILPHANTLFREKLNNIGKSGITAILREGVFIDVVPGFIFYFQEVNPVRFSAHGAYIEDYRNPRHPVSIIAQNAYINYNRNDDLITFDFKDGLIMLEPSRHSNDAERFQIIRFVSYRVYFSPGELGFGAQYSRGGKNEMTMGELRKAVAVAESAHKARRYALEFHIRIVLPLSCLGLGFLAPLFCLTMSRKLFRLSDGSMLPGTVFVMLSYLLYYFLISLNKGLAENGLISPFVAAWIPLLLASGLAAWFWIRMK